MQVIIKKILNDSSIYSIEPILKKIVLFFLLPLYTAYLTPSDYGVLEYIITICTFFTLIATGGLETGFFKFGFGEPDEIRKTVLFNTLILTICLSVGTFMIAYFCKEFFFDSRSIAIGFLVYFLGNIINKLYNFNLLVLRYKHEAKKYVVISIVSFLLLIMLNILLVVHYKMGYFGIIYANLIANVLSFILFTHLLIREISIKFDIKKCKEILKFSLPMVPGNLAALLMTMSDRFFIEKYSSLEQLGLYSYGYKFGMLINVIIIAPFFMGWAPHKWQIFKMDNAKEIYSSVFYYLTNFFVVIIIAANLILRFLGTSLTSDESYTQGMVVLPLILSSYYYVALTNFQGLGVLFKGKTYLLSIVISISAIINLVLNWILIPTYGIIGASIATLIAYIIYFILYYTVNQYHYKISFNLIDLVLNSLIIVIFCFTMTYIDMESDEYYYLYNIVFLLASSLIVWFKFKNELKSIMIKLKRKVS